MKQILITISPTGAIELETRGFAGGTCREASRLLEQALGVVTADRPTAEAFCSLRQPQPQQEPPCR